MKVAYLGMGIMGAPMAANLARGGAAVAVWNRTPDRPGVALAREAGCAVAASVAEAVREAKVVFACVTNAADAEAVLLEAASHAPAGALFVDCSTIGPAAARAIGAKLAERGVRFLDAPVSGGDVGARAGTLTIMVGGAEADYGEARPLLEKMGRAVRLCGPLGAGQAVKLCNQVLVAGHMVALTEAFRVAESLGLDPALVVEVCGGGGAASWALANLGPRAASGDFAPGFRVRDLQKDLGFVAEALGADAASLGGLAWSMRAFAALAALPGGADQGTQALIRAYRKR